ncbi:protein-tyrosine-phosphatase [Actinoplanes ianthinogenes]|uniref:Protein-tyrosine-phosphatase n=1 Tax=Actinoplanes ianthinogenes TaxID=122358 RepID=A0ABM7M0G3_9ACTN|nr:protein-tyrosine phosphatase family protein [Actinoplanes ianthinogenes]BCJ45091.1 protein-tyrosine-phosphatase [Actinoplanes ianthinogenes]GGR40517.1 protein-tyrosine-phosphatase [Actinoplanes ianthinogenes]
MNGDSTWDKDGAGVLRLPSGRLIRGRGLRAPMPTGHPPRFGVYVLGAPPPEFGWESRWVRWRDFWVPADPAYLKSVLTEALRRADRERVEIACFGGVGRTGTALACLAVLDGVPAGEAVDFVREHYHRHAVETPWQRRFVTRFENVRPPA